MICPECGKEFKRSKMGRKPKSCKKCTAKRNNKKSQVRRLKAGTQKTIREDRTRLTTLEIEFVSELPTEEKVQGYIDTMDNRIWEGTYRGQEWSIDKGAVYDAAMERMSEM